MADEVDLTFHYQMLLKQPAWIDLMAYMEKKYAGERDRMPVGDQVGRWAVSLKQTELTEIQRHAVAMSRPRREENAAGS